MQRVVIWDWNGTLLDDTPAAVEALNVMLSRRSLESVSLDFYKDRFRFPARSFYEEIGIRVDDSEWDDLAREYHETYALMPVRLASDAMKAIAILSRSGVRQTLASALRQDLLEKSLERFSLSGVFATVKGSDNLDGAGKIQVVRSLIEAETAAAGGGALRFVMIGDAIHDKEVADALGIDCVLSATGGHSARRLSAHGRTCLTLEEAARCALEMF